MSASIEERVVSIKFDNSKFEANVKTTLTSLSTLKKSLDFSGGVKALGDLDRAGKNINLKFDNKGFVDSTKATVDAAAHLKSNLKFDGVTKGLSDLDAAGKKVNLKLDPKGFQDGARGVVEAANVIKQNLNFESVQRSLGGLRTSASNISFESIISGTRRAARGLADMDLAGKAVNMMPIQQGADQASGRLTAMSAAGIAALGALAFKGIEVGQQLAQHITGPMKQGLEEYETNLNSIQTILANTQHQGTNLGDVNGALDELNTYSDKTIYNFSEMARNIGTFTSAGVDLKTSTGAIKGIANLAALSGSNSQQASTAMYQLSQALSTGKVSLMDWNSVVNAGMGGKVFQDAIIETAKNQGIAVDGFIEKNGSFRDSLQEGWLTSSVLTETLSKFTGDLNEDQLRSMGYNDEQIAANMKMAQTASDAATKIKTFSQLTGALSEATASGWSQTWKWILGDFEQAKAMWTDVYDVLGGIVDASSDSRNQLFQSWNALGGRTEMIWAVSAAFKVLMGILNPVQEAFREVFPPMTGQKLYEITSAIRQFIEVLIPGQAQTSLLKNSFKLLFTIIKMGLDVIGGAIGVVVAFFRAFATGGDSINGSLKPLTDALGQMADRIKNSTFITEFFARVTRVAEVLGTALGQLIPKIIRIAQYIADTATLIWLSTGYYMQMFASFVTDVLIEALNDGIAVFDDVLDVIENVAKALPKIVKAFLEGGFDAATKAFEDSLTTLGNVGELVFKRIIERVESIKRFAARLAAVWDEITAAIQRVWDKMLPFREAVADLLGGLGEELQAVFADVNYDDTLDMVNTGLLAGLFFLFKGFFKKLTGMGDGVKDDLMKHLSTSVEGINDVLEALTGTLGAMQQNLQADTLMKIAIAIGLLTISVVALSMIDSGKLTKGLVAIGVMVFILGKAMEALDKISIGSGFLKIPFLAASMILLAIALAILVIPVKMLSEMSWGELIKGLAGTIALMMGLAKAAEIMSRNPANLIATGVGLIAVAIAIKILASAVKDISELSFGNMIKGLIGVGALLTALSIFNNLTKVNKGSIGTAAGLILLGIALKVMASALGDFAAMDVGSLIQGLAVLGVVLVLLSRFTMTVDGAKVFQTAAAMVVLGIALKVMASALRDFAGMSWEEIAKGLIVMSVALNAMSKALARVPPNMLTSAVGFIAIAAGLKLLASALQDFAGMSWEEIAKGLSVLAASLILISVAMIAMQGTISGAVALFIVSAALMALSIPMKIFSEMTWDQMLHGFAALAGIFVIFGLAGLVLAPIVPVLFSLGVAIGMLGLGLMGIGLGTALFAAGLVVIATAVAVAGPILIGFIASILAMIPLAMVELGKGIIAFAQVIGDAMPIFLNAFVALLNTLLDAVDIVFPRLMDTLWMVIVELVALLVRGIPLFVDAGMKIILGLLNGINNNIGQIIDAAYKLVREFLDGIARNLPGIIDSGVKLIVSFVQGLADGIRNNSAAMNSAGWDLASAIVEGMVGGIAEGVGRVVAAAQNLAGDAINAAKKMLGINSPSKVFFGFGKWVDEGFADGIDRYSHLGSKSAESMGEKAIKTMQKTIAGIDVAASMETDYAPTIRPVLDLSAIRKDSGLVAGMLAPPALAISGVYGKASAIAAADRVRRESVHNAGTTTEAVTPVAGATYSFTQINNSPKALNNAEIYRQNKNLISVVKQKGALTTSAG